MHFGVREMVATISAAALIFFCSCEKHRIGEDPEVQKEHVDEAKGGSDEENASGSNKAEATENATPSRTPAEFFPKTTPSP